MVFIYIYYTSLAMQPKKQRLLLHKILITFDYMLHI